jgi:1,4-alpha-glucan branching enzyme
LANSLIHHLRPDAVTIAEDLSAMPGLGVALENGGAGFDYRFAMGVPDQWIRLTKDTRDEDWHLGRLWFELNNRRPDERTVSYAESHDQALVGDQSLLFRLIGADMYEHMHRDDDHLNVDRGMALHKMIRLITIATAGHGYLNFMGNEFGHPEWIDFPREENGWSYKYARRQWHLVDDPELKYRQLDRFDKEMIRLIRNREVLNAPWPYLLHEHNEDKVLAFHRKGLFFVFNFNPAKSYTDYGIRAPAGSYRMLLDTDRVAFGGHGRLTPDQIYQTQDDMSESVSFQKLQLYLPTRTALILKAE